MKTRGTTSRLHRRLQPFLWLLVALLLIVLAAIVTYLFSAQTAVSGKRVMRNLGDSVVISFDESDIPHIKANSSSDALFALGYLHATERSWQLEMNRRIGSGRLSEILGKDTVPIDRFIRTLGIKRAAERQYDRYPAATKHLLQAYADGVNTGNASLGWALPIEYFLTGSKPGHWSPTDSVAWMLMMAYDLGGNWQQELQRLELSQFLSTKQVWEVVPPHNQNEILSNLDFAKMYRDIKVFNPATGPAEEKSKNLPATELAFLDLPGGKDGIGSNNWALSGKLSSSGKPLLANDPHLGLSAPAIWYFAHLDAPGINVIGASLPGIPGIVLGRTDKFAWSFTNTGPDVQDLYIEQIDTKNPGMYRGPDGSQPFKVRQEIIEIKGAAPLTFLVKETRHGPVISDAYARAKRTINTEQYALALRWTALDIENQSVAGLLELNQASNMESFQQSLRKNYAPMQNVVMADVEGNIAYQAAGVAPKRTLHQGLYGVAPALGWDKQYDWTGYIPFDHLPASNNPEQGWLATANQKIIAANDPNPLTGDWDLPTRYDRIVDLIKAKNIHNLDSMKAMQADTLSLGATPLLDLFKSSRPTHTLGPKAMEISQSFNGDMKADSAAALIFNAWADQLTRNLFSRLSYLFTENYGARHFRLPLITQLQNPNSPWCDDPKTQAVESCLESSNNAYDKALVYLSKEYGNDPKTWVWGKAHSAVSEHRPLTKVPLLGSLFNIETPFAGDSFSINVGRLQLLRSSNPYETFQAPSLRTIYDLADLEQSLFIYQTGQSGWVQSKLYRNMTPLWAKNEYLPLQMKPAKITRELELKPR
ncbi:penicillin acylase family protein [Polynucleobacter sp. AP-Latsch-80-C2]|jgi:penicillin amidase|uniref:penicillin acylase family protein n=1 Tax=Polynucleobacter sp. AP-Latsch-80-C2 TaxID=2576931 RepID=UPI001C0D291A|nr:penicillin acylase family protein [Polynucleobacter sp. AP-Latsch-80-C2]MBU3623419.1 penicillin acylase family protein [Polynucleobacter sp. AP-Latsch-80-C2]